MYIVGQGGSCADTSYFELTINQSPDIEVVEPSYCDCFDLNLIVVNELNGVDGGFAFQNGPADLNICSDQTIDVIWTTSEFCTDLEPINFQFGTAANAGEDSSLDLCNEVGVSLELIDQLNGTPDAGGTWYYDNTVITGLFTPGYSDCGEYTYVVEGSGSCENDTSILTINCVDPFEAIDLTYVCDANYENYTVSFQLINGDLTTVDVDPGIYPPGSIDPITGIYTSDLIPNGNGFSFEISDASSCTPLTVSGSYDCSCATASGVFDFGFLAICADDQNTIVTYDDSNQINDGDDVLAFYVVTDINDILGSEVTNPNFNPANYQFDLAFDPISYVFDQTYYLVAAIGNDDGSSNPDFSDACTQVSAVEFIYYSNPTISIQPLANTCLDAGDCVDVVFEFTGEQPFNFSYNNNGQNNDVFNINDTQYTLNICQDAILEVTSFNDQYCSDDNFPIIEIASNTEEVQNQQICQGQTFTDECLQSFSMTGQYTCDVQLPNGCTHTIITNLEVVEEIIVVIDTLICSGDQIIIDGNPVSDETTITLNDMSVAGCDSLTTINVFISEISESIIDTAICEGDIIELADGTLVSDEDYYQVSLTDILGCDSNILYVVSYETLDTLADEILLVDCQTGIYFFPDGTSITNDAQGIYMDCSVYFYYEITFQNCLDTDSITVCPGQLASTSCGDFLVANDSVIVCATAYDTVIYNIYVTDTIFINTVIPPYCEGDIHVTGDGTPVGQTLIYTYIELDPSGCVTQFTEDIVFNPIYNSSENVIICEGDVFFQDTIIIDTFSTQFACDSIVETIYTVINIDTTIIDTTICFGDVILVDPSFIIDSPGTYIDTIDNAPCYHIDIYNVIVAGSEPDTNFVSICPDDCYNLPDGSCESNAGTYCFDSTLPSGCMATTCYDISINALDDAYFTYINDMFCNLNPNETPDFIATPGGSFSISPTLPAGDFNTATGEINFSSTESGEIYDITYITPFGGCPSDSTFTIAIDSAMSSTFMYSNPICINEANQFPIQVENTGGTFSSTNGNLMLDATTGELDLAAMLASGFNSNQTFDINYTIPGPCGSTSDYQIEILALEDAGFAYDQNTYCPDAGFAVINTVSSNNGIFSINDTTVLINENTGELDLSTVVANTTYEITYTVGNCASNASQQIFIENVPEPILSLNSEICFGDSLFIELTNADAYENVSFNWDFYDAEIISGSDEGPYVLAYAEVGLYPITLQINEAICEINPVSELINVSTLDLVVSEGMSTYATVPVSLNSSANGSSNLMYEWLNETTLNCNYCPNPIAKPLETTTYILEVTDTLTGCTVSDSVLLKVENELPYVPNVFTPNGDGTNETFKPVHTRSVEEIMFRVFNRWGELVFETNEVNKGWDGMFNEKLLNTEVFVWTVSYTFHNGDVVFDKGNVTLLR